VAILAEYDALPELGHGCGHNLIAMIGTAAAVGVQSVLDSLPGTLAAIGTPAEEGGGGKVALLRAGGFDGVDTAMMIHPTSGRSRAPRAPRRPPARSSRSRSTRTRATRTWSSPRRSRSAGRTT